MYPCGAGYNRDDVIGLARNETSQLLGGQLCVERVCACSREAVDDPDGLAREVVGGCGRAGRDESHAEECAGNREPAARWDRAWGRHRCPPQCWMDTNARLRATKI